jgi:hypothetical protein
MVLCGTTPPVTAATDVHATLDIAAGTVLATHGSCVAL